MEHDSHEATYALQGVILPRETEQRILEIAESAASPLNLPPAVRCTTAGWFGALRSVSADFEV